MRSGSLSSKLMPINLDLAVLWRLEPVGCRLGGLRCSIHLFDDCSMLSLPIDSFARLVLAKNSRQSKIAGNEKLLASGRYEPAGNCCEINQCTVNEFLIAREIFVNPHGNCGERACGDKDDGCGS